MDILSLPVLTADYRIAYGSAPSQFGDLWLPRTPRGSLLPVVVFFHGGWWKSEYDLGYAGRLCSALKNQGIACWSIEYRRVGNAGGGWPGTFQDAATGFDFLAALAKSYPLDLGRVLTMGHSAGGHLAFWIAGRHHVDPGSEIFLPGAGIALRGAVALAGAVDLRLIIELSEFAGVSGDGAFAHDLFAHDLFAHDRDEVLRFMGGSPPVFPARYHAGNPGDLLPFQAPQVLVQGTADDQIPPGLPARWAAMSHRLGSSAVVSMLSGMDHFDVVDPASRAWPVVLTHAQRLLSTL